MTLSKGSRAAAIILFLAVAGAPAAAQQPPAPAGAVLGVLAGPGAVLGAAAVEVYAPDTTLITGAITDEQGRFRVTGLPPGQYLVRASFIGHTPHMQSIVLSPAAPVVDLGLIRLTPAAVQLDAIAATTDRGAVSMQVDRTVFSARQAGLTGGNAGDVLRGVPGLEVDLDGKLSMRGNGNVAVQINGRPAPMRGDALAAFLRQLPASTVDRVEVLPNPSSRYDPEGMAGIVNIVLRQDTDLGLSGGASVSAGTGDKYNGSGSLGWQAGRITLLGMLAANNDRRGNDTYTWRENVRSGASDFLEQETAGALRSTGLMFNGSAEYRFDPRLVLASSLMLNRVSARLDSRNLIRSFDAAGEPLHAGERLSDLDQRLLIGDASLSLRRVVKPGHNEMATELRINRMSDDLLSRFDDVLSGGAREFLRSAHVDGVNRDLSLQTDVTRMLGTTKIEFGQKLSQRTVDSDEARRVSTADAATGSAFEYEQRVAAAYAVLSRAFGATTVQGGLRAEHTGTDFRLIGGDSFDSSYFDLFPSASVLHSLSDTRKLRLSYSRRIQRPQAQALNPFPRADEPLNQMVGNPGLRPEHTDAVELAFQQFGARGSLQIQPFLRRTTDAIRITKSVDEANMATTTFSNLATSSSYGMDVTLSGRLGSRLNGMTSVSGFRMTTEGTVDGAMLSSEALTWNARANLSYRISPRTTAQWMVFHRAPLDVEQGTIRAFTASTVAVQQRVLGERGTLNLRISDPLDVMRLTFNTADAQHRQTSWRKVESQIAQLTFSYAFGQQPRVRQRAPEQQDDPLQIRIH